MTFPKQITSEFELTETDLLFRKLKDYDDTVIFYTKPWRNCRKTSAKRWKLGNLQDARLLALIAFWEMIIENVTFMG